MSNETYSKRPIQHAMWVIGEIFLWVVQLIPNPGCSYNTEKYHIIVMQDLSRLNERTRNNEASHDAEVLLYQFVAASLDNGDIKEAFQIAQETKNAYHRTRVLKQIIDSLPSVADTEDLGSFLVQAQHVVDGISDPYYKSDALCRLAVGSTQVGDRRTANKFLVLAYEEAKGIIDSHSRAKILTQLAESSIQIQDTEASSTAFVMAIKAGGEITRANSKDMELDLITKSAIKVANETKTPKFLEHALGAAELVTDPYFKDCALDLVGRSAVIIAYETQNTIFLDLALKAAERIPSSSDRKTELLSQIAESAFTIGDNEVARMILAQVLKVAEEIRDFYPKANMFTAIAESAARAAVTKNDASFLIEVLKTLNGAGIAVANLGNDGLRYIAEGAVRIAEARQDSMLLAHALAVTEAVAEHKTALLVQIVIGVAKVAEEKQDRALLMQALDVFYGITDDFFEYSKDKVEALDQIARSMAKIAEVKQDTALFAQAIKAAKSIPWFDYKAGALCQIAENMVQIGYDEMAKALLVQALQIAGEEVTGSCGQLPILQRIAGDAIRNFDSQEASALLNRAVNITKGVTDLRCRIDALCKIAETACEASTLMTGKALWLEALNAADEMSDSYNKVEALRRIVQSATEISVPDANVVYEVLTQTIRATEDIGAEGIMNWNADRLKSNVLNGIAESTIHVSDAKVASEILAQVLKTAEGMTDSHHKNDVLHQVTKSTFKIANREYAIALLTHVLTLVDEIAWSRIDINPLCNMIIESLVSIAETKHDAFVLMQALRIAEKIPDSYYKTIALRRISENAFKLANMEDVSTVVDQVLEIAEGRDDLLYQIVESTAKIAITNMSVEYLLQATRFAEDMTYDFQLKAAVLRQMADNAYALGDTRIMNKLIQQALTVAQNIRDPYHKANVLIKITETIEKNRDAQVADTLFSLVHESAEQITNLYDKASVLCRIAEGFNKIGGTEMASILLSQAAEVIEEIKEPEPYWYYNNERELKAKILGRIVVSTMNIAAAGNDTVFSTRAIEIVKRIKLDSYQFEALHQIIESAATMTDTKVVNALFAQVSKISTENMGFHSQVSILRYAAESLAKIGDRTTATRLLSQALRIVNRRTYHYSKDFALLQISESAAKTGNWRLARKIALSIENDRDKAKALVCILQIFARDRNTISARRNT